MNILVVSVVDKKMEAILKGGPPPLVDVEYELIKTGTVSYMQHRLFHPLVLEWYKSDMYPYAEIVDWWALRQLCKFKHGNGCGSYVYVNNKFQMIEVPTMHDIPDYAFNDYKSKELGGNGNHLRIKGKLQSLTTYKKSEMSCLIDNVIRAMMKSGVNTYKFNEIVEKIDFRA